MSAPKRLIRVDQALEDGVLSAQDCQALTGRILKMSTADAAEVFVNSNIANNLRFAANQVSTAGSVTDINIQVTSNFGPKHATVVTNNTSDEALLATVKQSEALAKLAPDDDLMKALERFGDTAVLQVTGPRIPCGTFRAHMAVTGWLKLFTQAARSGAYLSVVTPGAISAGDTIRVVHRPDHAVTSMLGFRALTVERELLPRATEIVASAVKAA